MFVNKMTNKEWMVHVLVWLIIGVFPLLTAYIDLGEVPPGMFVKQLMRPILFYVNYAILVPHILLQRKLGLYILLSIAFLLLYNYISVEFINHNVINEVRAMRDRQGRPGGPMGMRHGIPMVFSLTVFLLGGIFSLVVDFYKRDRETKALENEQTEIKLQFLRNQLNPHFLFNSLNSIYSLVRSKSDNAPEAVITLSELMRYMLYEAKDEQVSLEKELNYIQHYIALQRLRLKNTEAVKLNINGDIKNLKIYPLLLISFIENAFKYGTDYKGNTHIDIKIEIIDNTFNFYIENIIGLYKRDDKNSGVGLENIKNQFNYLYKDNHTLTIEEDKSFYRVHLTLNLDNHDVHNN